jgi:hypothetical protein
MWPAHKRVHVRREDCANVQISGMDLTGRVCEPRSVRHRRLIRHESPGRAACSSLVVARRARARTSRADEQALPGAKAPTKFRATERGLRSTSKRVVLGAAPQGHSRRVWRVIPSGSVGTDTPKSETAETARLPYHGAVIGGATPTALPLQPPLLLPKSGPRHDILLHHNAATSRAAVRRRRIRATPYA